MVTRDMIQYLQQLLGQGALFIVSNMAIGFPKSNSVSRSAGYLGIGSILLSDFLQHLLSYLYVFP